MRSLGRGGIGLGSLGRTVANAILAGAAADAVPEPGRQVTRSLGRGGS